jgi:hypothetical protein
LSFFSCSICFFFLVFIIILRPLQAPLTYIHTSYIHTTNFVACSMCRTVLCT